MLYLLVSLFASMIGAICGIGGGVIIKPVLDMVSSDPTSTINFLSGCAVLAMSTYSVIKAVINDAKAINYTYMVPLAVGSAAGGLFGNALFGYASAHFANPAVPRIMQSGILALVVFISLVYTINKNRIKTKKVENKLISMIVGFALGTMSSFLGIGGGPVNLVVLYYFFSKTTK